jgi:hypothetical protein
MDPISIVGGVAAIFGLLCTAKNALNWCCSIPNPPEHVQELYEHIFLFETVIKSLQDAIKNPRVQACISRKGTDFLIRRARETLSRFNDSLNKLLREGDPKDVSRLRAAFMLSKCRHYQEKLNQYCQEFDQLLAIAVEIEK